MSDVVTDVVNDVVRAAGFETRWVGCVKCQTEWVQFRILNRQTPECPTCNGERRTPEVAPPRAHEMVAPKYSGDIITDLHRAGVNVRKYGRATLAAAMDRDDPQAVVNYDPHAIDAAWAWIESWRLARPKRYASIDWMYFYGANSDTQEIHGRIAPVLGELGNGKTYLGIAIARYLIEQGDLDPHRYRFVTAEALLLEAEATFRGDDESEFRLLKRYEDLELLHIDEFGARAEPKPHAVRVFDEITKRREAHGTIWTSNLSIPVLMRAMPELSRINDRLLGECGDGSRYCVKFGGPSRRIQRSQMTLFDPRRAG